MQGLNLSVVDLLGRPGEYRDFTVTAVLTDVRNALARLENRPIQGDLRAESVVEGILVTGSVQAEATFDCARCLSSFELPMSLELCELFLAPGHEAPADEDSYEVAGKEVHLEPMLRDAVVLALPLKPVCRDDCAGLCAGCGRNLNEDACICSNDETDPRWAELAVLRERLQG
ncbi:MAG: DUF177 domain-containing protein [Actinomycetota bacterium]|nr:DUF177 domain-containing protein [Actinomycetota bacterium]